MCLTEHYERPMRQDGLSHDNTMRTHTHTWMSAKMICCCSMHGSFFLCCRFNGMCSQQLNKKKRLTGMRTSIFVAQHTTFTALFVSSYEVGIKCVQDLILTKKNGSHVFVLLVPLPLLHSSFIPFTSYFWTRVSCIMMCSWRDSGDMWIRLQIRM